MRKTIMLLMLVMVVGGLHAQNEPKMALHLGAGGLYAADEGYRGVYGDVVLVPHLELSYRLSGSIGLWAGYTGLSKEGTGPVSGIATSSAQHYVSLGGAYRVPLAEKVLLALAAGPLLAFYREEAGKYLEEGSTLGADLHATLSWSLSRSLALDLNLGYLLAWGESKEGESFKLGGFWGCLGLAWHF